MSAHLGGGQVRLQKIRAHEGSQARAWEELAYQLRPPVGEGHVETRKTRAPDAGVEWYELEADGHEEGFQAKFLANLADALGGMRESVEAVCTKRPNLTRLTFVVPYDFTDSGIAASKLTKIAGTMPLRRWRRDFPAASNIEFATIRAGDIKTKLALREHAGRREYWFGGLEITDEWLTSRFEESVRATNSLDRSSPFVDVRQLSQSARARPRPLVARRFAPTVCPRAVPGYRWTPRDAIRGLRTAGLHAAET